MSRIKNLPEMMNGWQCLAWAVWRTPEAVKIFSGGDAPELWGATLAGRPPKGLRRRRFVIPPREAEVSMLRAMANGDLKFSWIN